MKQTSNEIINPKEHPSRRRKLGEKQINMTYNCALEFYDKKQNTDSSPHHPFLEFS